MCVPLRPGGYVTGTIARSVRSALEINQIRNSSLVSCGDDGSGVTVFEKNV